MAGLAWFRLSIVGLCFLTGCIPTPPQPTRTEPYALLEFPRTMHLVAVDGQAIDERLVLSNLRVAPGRRTLHFAYTASGAEGSRQHDGQKAGPFVLDTQPGRRYLFEAKT